MNLLTSDMDSEFLFISLRHKAKEERSKYQKKIKNNQTSVSIFHRLVPDIPIKIINPDCESACLPWNSGKNTFSFSDNQDF